MPATPNINAEKIQGNLSLTTLSATTYYNLPTDIRVTGGTYSSGTAIFTNNTGGTFSVTGFTTGGGGTTFTGGTVNGETNFTNGLSANTISATTISGSTFYGNGLELTRVRNLVTVGLSGTNCDYSSIKSAVNSITGASSANTYVVSVGPGVFYEDTITMKSYVDVVGESATNTIIQANDPNSPLIVGADQSMVNNVQIQGCTGTSVAAVIYSSSTTPQLNAIFYVENVRFGANYTHVKNIGTGGGNSIIQCSNVKYGGYPFTLGFYCTNDGSGIGRMQLRNVTSTNGGVISTTGLVFAKADKSGCGFIVNGCLLTKSNVGGAAGTGFWVEDGGFLRLTAVNFQRWSTGIYAPQTGTGPSIDAIALNFENCTTDVDIIHSGTTGKIQGTDSFLKTKINIDAPLYEVNTDPRQITVAKKGADFTSIKSAVDYLISSGNTSSTNRYVITVGPGVFIENEIDLTQTPYVSIVGSNIQTTQILPNTNSQHIIKIGINNEISFLSLSGAPSGYAGLYCYDVGDYAQAHKLSFYDCNINVWVESNTQDTKFFGEYLDYNGDYEYGTKVIGNNGYLALANMENYFNFPTGAGVTYCNYATGSGATISIFVGDNQSNGVSGSTAFYVQDGAELYTSTITADGFTYGIRNPNVGDPIRFDVDNASFINGEWDLYIERNGTFGTFGGSSSHEKLYSVSSDVYWALLDIEDGEFDITRKASVTFADGTHTDFTTLIFEGSTMGLMQGGDITIVSGFTVNTDAGFGYLAKTLTPEVIMRIDWLNSQITLGANENKYIYINENSILSSSGTRPSSVNNIVLGRVVTNSTGVSFIDLSPVHSDHTSNRFASLFREALGPIYAQGSIVTENVTPFKLDVTDGEYYYSTGEFTPSGGTGVTFTQYIRNGSGGWVTSATTYVAVGYDDNSGTLSPLTLSAYTKHTLYVVGSGSYENYFLVLGQDEYTTLVEAEGALLPTPPTYFEDSVTQIASIYIQQGNSNIFQIEDIRPVIGFKAGGVNASSVHGNLLGLAADDHTQYLLVSGGRAMAGDLSIGGNDITNVGTVNGVTVETHATRHQFGGSDPVGSTTPGANYIPYADVSGTLDSWVSTATTTTLGRVKLSTAPASSSNPIAIGENDDRFLTSFTGGTYSGGVIAMKNVSGGTYNITGLYTGSTDVFVTGGTKLGTNITFTNNTGGTFNVTGITDTFVTGGTYNRNNGVTTFTNSSGGTFTVNGYMTTAVTGGTYSAGTITLTGSIGNSTGNISTITGLTTTFTGGTVTGPTIFTGGLSANTISATTYVNLPTDITITGATYSNNTFTYTNNTGGTFNVLFNTVTGLTVNGNLTVTGTTSSGTISATTYQNLPTDIKVTGGTYSNGTATFTNNTGGTFNVTGFFTSANDTYVTGVTYSANTITIKQNQSQPNLTATVGLVTKTGTVTAGSFTGTPKKYTVTFTTPYATTNYVISLTGSDNRVFTYESKSTTGFIINTNANTALTGNVDWTTISIGES